MVTANHVIVGMSGGVDSSVCAALLVEQGWHVEGVFMKNWDEDDGSQWCTARADYDDARRVADKLGIELHVVNFAAEYWDQVFTKTLAAIKAGLMPNPDIWCNRFIKFDVFRQHARTLGADMIATGHYARLFVEADTCRLYKAIDHTKDQSYFLSAVAPSAFANTLFPLGEYQKVRIRRLAADYHFPNADKKDSTGICFIGERPFRDFIRQYLPVTDGEIVDENGRVIGKHSGLFGYTIGQRSGLGIGGGHGVDEAPWYVAALHVATNRLVAVQGHDHPLLLSHCCTADALNWLGTAPREGTRLMAKTRYRQPDQPCVITAIDDTTVQVAFDVPQRAVTCGQSLVLYDGDMCLGGGSIIATDQSLAGEMV